MSEQEHPSILDRITVAAPCPANWDDMTGDDQVRHCQECKLNVYNLSAMTRDEAETLLANKDGRLCVRYFQRADGTIITQDCPVGLRVLHRKRIMRRAKTGSIAAAIALVTVAGAFVVAQAGEYEKCPIFDGKNDPPPQTTQPVEPTHPTMGNFIMGDVAEPIPYEPPPQPQPRPIKGKVKIEDN